MRDLTYRLVIRAFRLVFAAFGWRVDVRGERHIPTDGPAVLASNHLGFLDFTFAGVGAADRGRLVRFMAKQSTFEHWASRRLMRAMGHIPVDRHCGAVAYRKAARALAAGEIVGVFPEATISRAWTLKPFKLGAATLAVKQQVPLVPVVLWGSQRILTVGGHRTLRRGTPVSVRNGAALRPGIDFTTASDPRDIDAELCRRMQFLLDEAVADYPDRARNDCERWWMPAHLGGSAPGPEQAAVLDAAAIR